MPNISLRSRFDRLEASINALESKIEQGFADVKTELRGEVNRAIDEVGRMVKQGFDHVDERFDHVDGRLTKLEQGTDRIQLRLDQAAYRFEFVELAQRVGRLENQTGRIKP